MRVVAVGLALLLDVMVAAAEPVRDPADPTKWKCEPVELTPRLVTSDGAAIPKDGGVLVAWTLSRERSPDWRFVADGRSIVPAAEVLAPGVTVYRAGGRVVSIAAAGTRLATFTAGTASASLSAPKLEAMHKLLDQKPRARAMHATIEAQLAEAPPADAVGVILYRLGSKKRVALAFELLEQRGLRIVVYDDPYACEVHPAGMEAASLMDRVAIAWVDAFGRVSPESNVVKVTE